MSGSSLSMMCVGVVLTFAHSLIAQTVPSPITATLSVSPNPAMPGDRVVWAITVVNAGSGPVHDVLIRSTVPQQVRSFWAFDADAVCVNLTLNCSPGAQIRWSLGSLPAGASKTVLMPAELNPNSAPARILVEALVSWSGGSTTISTELPVVAEPGLMAAVLPDSGALGPESAVGITLVFTNRGRAVVNGVVTRLITRDGAQFASPSDSGMVRGSETSWPPVRLAPGGVAVRRVQLQALTGTAGGSLLRLEALAGAPGTPEAVAASNVMVRTGSPLRVIATAIPATARPGELVTFAVRISNESDRPLEGVTLRGVVPDHVQSFLALGTGAYCVNKQDNCVSGSMLHWDVGTLPARQSRTYLVPGVIRPGSPPSGSISRFSAYATSSEGGDYTQAAAVVTAEPTITVAVAREYAQSTAGSYVVYLANRSRNTLKSTRVQLCIPQANSHAREQVWELGDIGAGQVRSKRVSLDLASVASSANRLFAAATASADDEEHGAFAQTLALETRAPQLALAIAGGPDPVRVGASYHYAVTVRNESTAEIPGLILRALMPDTLAPFIGLAVGAGCSNYLQNCTVGTRMSWDLGNLPPHESRTVFVPASIPANSTVPDGTLLHLTVVADGSEDTLSQVTHVQPVRSQSGLHLVMTGERPRAPAGRDVARLVIRVGNSGGPNPHGESQLRLQVPESSEILSAPPGAVRTGSEVTWPVDLDQGESRTFVVEAAADALPYRVFAASSVLVDRGEGEWALARSSVLADPAGTTPFEFSTHPEPDAGGPGDRIGLVMRVRNRSSAAIADVVVSSVVPDFVWPFDGTTAGIVCHNATSTCTAGTSFHWNVGELAPDAQKELKLGLRIQNLGANVSYGNLAHFHAAATSTSGEARRSTSYALARPTVLLSTRSVVNGASFWQTAAAPGLIISIFGEGVGPATPENGYSAASGRFESNVKGTQVLFDGKPASILYLGPNQINAVVPFSVSPINLRTAAQVVGPGTRSNTVDLTIVHASPGIFSVDGTGAGGGAVLNEDGTLNSPQNPAARGTVVQIFGTGHGQTDPPSTDGVLTGADPARIVGPVNVRIGNQFAAVEYAGAAPGLVAGVFQVNARVPLNIPVSASTPLVLDAGFRYTQGGITVAVK